MNASATGVDAQSGHLDPATKDMERPDGVLRDGAVVVIERRQLVRDAIVSGFAASLAWPVHGYASIEDCLASRGDWRRTVIVHSALGEEGDALIARAFDVLAQAGCPAAIMVLADHDESASVVEAFKRGARGYIPMDLPVCVAAQAIRLVVAGGSYVPVSCLSCGHAGVEPAHGAAAPLSKEAAKLACMFTARQTAVIEALRRGKANKVIAYELNMRESTVKVHVRNIMKKLNARNRTEVAYRANELLELRR